MFVPKHTLRYKNFMLSSLVVAICAGAMNMVHADVPVGTAFTYQGRVKQNGVLITGRADFQFKLFNALSRGSQVGSTQTILADPNPSINTIDKGLFNMMLDFGDAAFDGNARWLEIALRMPPGSGSYVAVSPRQDLSPAPYAISSGGWSQLNGNSYVMDGNVGIGISNPTRTLEVVDLNATVQVTGAQVGFGLSSLANGPAWAWGRTSDVGGANDDLKLIRYSNNAYAGIALQVQNSTGNVGIGTSSPTSLLHVNGAVTANTLTTIGNVGIGTSSPASLLHVNGAVTANTLTTIGNVICNAQLYVSSDFNANEQTGNLIVRRSSLPNRFMYFGYDAGNYAYIQSIDIGTAYRPLVLQPNGSSVGIGVFPQAGRMIDVAGGAHCTGTAWVPTSDRNMKENFSPVDSMDILRRLTSVPLSTWNFISEDDAIRHLGPMAQDFHAAFGLNGSDEKSLNPLDTTGVAFASIQALHLLLQDQKQDLARQRDKNDQQDRVIAQQQAQLATHEQKIYDLSTRVAEMENMLKQMATELKKARVNDA